MDERRALLAVVLIFLVLFGYNFIASRTGQKPVAEPVDSTEGVAERAVPDTVSEGGLSAVGSGSAERVFAAPVEEPGADGEVTGAGLPERAIVVESPLWVATFSTRGASVTSWRLLGYEAAGGGYVDLVPPDKRGLELDVRYGPSVIETGRLDFRYDGPNHLTLVEGGASSLKFDAVSSSGVQVSKEYVLSPDAYAFRLLVGVGGLVEPGARREVWIGWPGVVPSEKREDDNAIGTVALVDGKVARTRLRGLKDEDVERESGVIDWVASQSQYFVTAVMPEGDSFIGVETTGDAENRAAAFTAGLRVEGEAAATAFAVYAGPQDYHALREMGRHLDRAIDLGWTIFRPLSVFMLVALRWAYRLIPNYGVVIILFSIITKLLFYRLTHKSFTEMKRMQDLQPKLQALKEKLGGDREALARAQMELYKKEGVNPMGSCLPMLLQMPVFIALYQVLRTTIELRGAPFALWITDLSMPDTVAFIAGFPIHVLPLLMGAAMLAQQRMSSKDPSQAIVNNLMPIVFTALFYNFASGLVLYWLVNTVLSVAQQFYVQRGSTAARTADAATPDGAPAPSPPAPPMSVPNESPRAGGARAVQGRRRRRK